MAASLMDLDISQIENKLKKLWEEQKESNQIRACLFTLIIYATRPEMVTFLHGMVHDLVERYPCRIIFIHKLGADAPDTLTAAVTSAIYSQGSVSIACDQIDITVSPGQINRIPYIVLPLLVADLPVYLLWAENPTTETEILPKLQRYASRLIFHSDCAENLPLFCKNLLNMMEHTKLEFRDFNWAVAGGWREVLAQTFDCQSRIDHLNKCNEITITYNSQRSNLVRHPEIQALYIQAWIASRMKWTYMGAEEQKGSHQLHYKRENGDLRITVKPQELEPGARNAGGILSFLASSDDGTIYSIARKSREPMVVVHISTPDTCELPATLSLNELSRGSSFLVELFHRPTSSHYNSVLKLLANMSTKVTS